MDIKKTRKRVAELADCVASPDAGIELLALVREALHALEESRGSVRFYEESLGKARDSASAWAAYACKAAKERDAALTEAERLKEGIEECTSSPTVCVYDDLRALLDHDKEEADE